MEIALKLTDSINRDIVLAETTVSLPPLDRIWQNFIAEVSSPGWIHLKLKDAGLHEWLNLLCQELPSLQSPGDYKNLPDCKNLAQDHQNLPEKLPETAPVTQNTFAVLSTYARCCSLLRLGMQEQIIHLEPLHPKPTLWALTAPQPITWLNADRQFHCTHPTEQRLIAQITDGLDLMSYLPQPVPPDRLWRLAQDLSQAFQVFHAQCRIFGTVKTDCPSLAQSRLGLVFITQMLLHWILWHGLHLDPPIEL